ncbi:MAG: anaerobic ribonucleoside-triphosphate reductase, partial [Clostridiales bacterium]|nr:anaerobic ribonucleoside-triphosphate reductase [Clostridiales bacterium]
MKVIKRNGQELDYDREKIIIAISKANKEVPFNEKISEDKIYDIVQSIEDRNQETMQVEDIQDIIEQKLMAEKKFILAKTY